MGMAEPWDKLSGESDEAYSRFLIYRNLGARRSLRRAYCHYLRVYDGYTGGTKRLQPPGNWTDEHAAHFWAQRAAAWDVRNLTAYGARLAVLHVRAVTAVAEKCVRSAERLEPGDDGWADLLESLRLVGEYLTPDVIRGIQERDQPLRQSPSAASSG